MARKYGIPSEGAREYRPKEEELEHTIEAVKEPEVKDSGSNGGAKNADVVCMVLGIVSIVVSLFFGLPGIVISIACSIVGLVFHKKARKSGMKNNKLTAGLVCAWVGIGIDVVKVVIMVVTLIAAMWYMNQVSNMVQGTFGYLGEIS